MADVELFKNPFLDYVKTANYIEYTVCKIFNVCFLDLRNSMQEDIEKYIVDMSIQKTK